MTPETKKDILSMMRQTWQDCGMDILESLGKKSITKKQLNEIILDSLHGLPEMEEFFQLPKKERDVIFDEAFPDKYYGY